MLWVDFIVMSQVQVTFAMPGKLQIILSGKSSRLFAISGCARLMKCIYGRRRRKGRVHMALSGGDYFTGRIARPGWPVDSRGRNACDAIPVVRKRVHLDSGIKLDEWNDVPVWTILSWNTNASSATRITICGLYLESSWKLWFFLGMPGFFVLFPEQDLKTGIPQHSPGIHASISISVQPLFSP